MNQLLSVVIPSFNEEGMIPRTAKTIAKLLQEAQIPYELLFVNDGSRDNTLEVLRSFAGPGVRYLSFSRNFGKEAAMYAGLQHARGDYVAIMDADLQHPPEMLKAMYE